MLQAHSGDSYGYRFERDGKSMVYSTDSEHKLEDQERTNAFVEFFRGADLVIFDAMYALRDAVSVKADWGHSSNIVGVELCQAAGAKRLCLFHHEPIYSDRRIFKVWRDTRRLEEMTRVGAPLEVLAAYDGLESRALGPSASAATPSARDGAIVKTSGIRRSRRARAPSRSGRTARSRPPLSPACFEARKSTESRRC
jgi:hypothetical protein